MGRVHDLPHDDSWNAEDRRAIGVRIRVERERQKLTQDQVWQAAHIARGTVQRVEAGEDVKLSTLLKILRVLGMPLAALEGE